jgi:hypothetical protein
MRLHVGFLVLLAVLTGAVGFADSPPVELDETTRLRAEVHRLKVVLVQTQSQLAQCQAQAAASQLSAEQAALETSFRALLQPPADARFNWQTLTFETTPDP